RANTFLRRYEGVTPFAEVDEDIAVVVALDGDWTDPEKAWESLRVERLSELGGAPLEAARTLRRLDRPGFEGIRICSMPSVGTTALRFLCSAQGVTDLAVAVVPRRLTVIALILRPDGSIGVSQNVLRVPGIEYDEPVPPIPYPRFVRDLQLAQHLYAAGELRSNARLVQDL